MFSANTSQVSEDRLYVEDVFSTYLYTGNGSTQTITNGIDLAGKGGLVWIKSRTDVAKPCFFDTARGVSKSISSNNANAEVTFSGVDQFNSTSFRVNSDAETNSSSNNYASWTFREAPKFFDVVTYTGNGTSGGSTRTLSHNLGVAPGMVIIKCTTTGYAWVVWHRSVAGNGYLNSTAAFADDGFGITVTSTTVSFGAGNGGVNANGDQYVAYLFAHDTTSDGIIQCGSATVGGSGTISATLGWEPQWVLVKASNSTGVSDSGGGWWIQDNMRGLLATDLGQRLQAQSSNAEDAFGYIRATSTGFSSNAVFAGSSQYIYIAIRRGPMRTPTSGTSVFAPSTAGATTDITVGFPADTYWIGRDDANWRVFDRLRSGFELATNTTGAEGTFNYAPTYIHWDSNSVWNQNLQSSPLINYFFRRAPSFFDEVCYTGTSATNVISHNLGAAPELAIFKQRSSSGPWRTFVDFGATTCKYLALNATDASSTVTYSSSSSVLAQPTATNITIGTLSDMNGSGSTYVAYLFASCPGVSKVGSYTGNGSSQTINCGFAAGARFVLIKRTDSTGDWYVWDSASGIVSGNDPHRSLNTTAARVTTDDSVDTDSSGFVVNQLSATNINVSSATYIYLAVA